MDEDGALQFVRVTGVTASSSTRATTLQVAGVGSESNSNDGERFDGVESTQPAGLMASPAVTSTAEAVCVRRGDELVALVIIDKGAAAQNVEAGETRLYGVGGDNATAVIRLRANGDIDITAKSARSINLSVSGGGSVVLAGGSLEVARRTDPVTAAAGLLTTLGQIVTLLNTAGPVVGAPGTVTPFTGPTVGTITSGAANVKA
jgi:phage gp45-like